jgi:hypothetical protein
MKKKKNGHIQAFPVLQELKPFIKSTAMTAITYYKNPLKTTYRNNFDEEEDIFIVDTDSYDGALGPEFEISSTIDIINAASLSSQVYPVIIFNEKKLGDRAELMKE